MASVEFLFKETTRRKKRLVIFVETLHKDSDIARFVYFKLKTDGKCTSASDRVTHHSRYRRHSDARQDGWTIRSIHLKKSSCLRPHCRRMPTARR